MSFFDGLGIVLAAYTAWSAYRGEVYGRSGAWGRRWHRDQEPARFWSVIVVYALLSVALVLWF